MVVNDLFDEVELERRVAAGFGLRVEVKSVIAASLPVAAGAIAVLFLTTKNQLFAFLVARGRLTKGEVTKIIRRMNLRAEHFLPPRAEPDYFQRVAEQKFQEVFPGRTAVRQEDLTFYETLVPYNPALVQIAEVVGGVVKQYDRDAVGGWRPALKFTYRRILTS
jgi:hypothetical protein